MVDPNAWDVLTNRLGVLNARLLTEVVGHEFASATMIAHGHAFSTLATNRQALKQRGALPRRPFPALRAVGLRIGSQLLQMKLIFFKRDVTRMHIGKNNRPLFPRQFLTSDMALPIFDAMDAPEREGPGVARIMEDLQRAARHERSPDDLPLVRT